jgi:hypothetical protein
MNLALVGCGFVADYDVEALPLHPEPHLIMVKRDFDVHREAAWICRLVRAAPEGEAAPARALPEGAQA